MANARYYLSIFMRRLPYFMIVAAVISAASIIIAIALPPAYVSQMQLIVEAPQIADNTEASAFAAPSVEQLRVTEQRLMTRANLLDIATRLQVLAGQDKLNPDEIVQAMRAHTKVAISTNSGDPPLMTVSFEAPEAAKAAAVLNEYLTLIQQQDVGARTERATVTLEFFQQEVARLNQALAAKSAAISSFKTSNIEALPDSLNFRLSQQAVLQERLAQFDRDLMSLKNQRELLVNLFNSTGKVAEARLEALTPEQVQLDTLRNQLNDALAVLSPENPRVKVLKARIVQIEEVVRAQPKPLTEARPETGNAMLDLQLAEIDSRVADLADQKSLVVVQFDKLTESIEKTPVNTVKLDELTLDYQNIQLQYNGAVDRLAKASTGERIEFMARGQRIAVIEPPGVPNEPSKPKRLLIAGGGSVFGFLAGIGLIVLMEVLNRSIRRPEDIVRTLGISPIATLPYIQTRKEVVLRRGRKLLFALMILVGVTALVYGVHTYYQPLDLIAERVMNKLGMRW
jgi:uncharacterized protein involved in exopolysaccharide biosynthesis